MKKVLFFILVVLLGAQCSGSKDNHDQRNTLNKKELQSKAKKDSLRYQKALSCFTKEKAVLAKYDNSKDPQMWDSLMVIIDSGMRDDIDNVYKRLILSVGLVSLCHLKEYDKAIFLLNNTDTNILKTFSPCYKETAINQILVLKTPSGHERNKYLEKNIMIADTSLNKNRIKIETLLKNYTDKDYNNPYLYALRLSICYNELRYGKEKSARIISSYKKKFPKANYFFYYQTLCMSAEPLSDSFFFYW